MIMQKITSFFWAVLVALVSFGQKTETVYLNPLDSISNMYVIIYPPKIPWKGFMFLIPSFGEAPNTVLTQTKIPTEAAQQGILTIVPTFKTGPYSLGVDTATQSSFLEILDHVTSRHKLIDAKFYIGGFSIGGTCAVKYAELANQKNYKYKPSAVFAIDPPLDFERFYNVASRNIRLSKDMQPNQEAVYMVDRLQKEIGGTPQTNKYNYQNYSPYSATDTTQKAIKALALTPIMFFSEPDINWWLSERGLDFYSMNIIDAAAMVNELRRLGNSKAILVTTDNKGYRQPGNRRHPHSWSIADPEKVIKWLLDQK